MTNLEAELPIVERNKKHKEEFNAIMEARYAEFEIQNKKYRREMSLAEYDSFIFEYEDIKNIKRVKTSRQYNI